MLVVPIQSNDHTMDALIIVLNDEGIERIKKHDPVQINILERTNITLHNPSVMVAYEENETTLAAFARADDIGGLIAHLTRGFEYRPDLGYNDGPYKPLVEKGKKQDS